MEIDGRGCKRLRIRSFLANALSEFNRKIEYGNLRCGDRSWCQGFQFPWHGWHSLRQDSFSSWHTKELSPYKFKMSSLHSATVLVPDLPPTLGYYNIIMQDSPPPSPPLKAPSQSPAPDTRPSVPSNSESYNCQWVDCSIGFTDPEVLYNHLCNDHIGRKSTNNLCLTCKWKDCGTSCAKRDHITSHLRGMPFPSLIQYQYKYLPSTHSVEAACLRGSILFFHRSLYAHSLPDMQEIFQAPTRSQKARENSYRGAPCAAQALQGNYRKRSCLRLPCSRRCHSIKGRPQ
jgi:hypothetical protein